LQDFAFASISRKKKREEMGKAKSAEQKVETILVRRVTPKGEIRNPFTG